uniref:Nitrilase n=1 Tax=Candidatus Kentrum sp. TC TaxID=2126339 RepID=A0A451A066_9GAMM|nr:MAG: nitrilase [Candidatus Kentron sp. TC]VFK46594.1 MAG: nitrilase [Candidatus Kentron sp. TC]VFK59422.1 MAG: nitrilase [Candidatus Kentron sp. TC]
MSKTAAIQFTSSANVEANLLETGKLVERATRNQARLVVLPENFAFMGHTSDLIRIREPHGHGPLQEFLSQLAKKHGIWLVGGTIPLWAEDPNKVRAASLVFDDQGRQVARYDKMHLFDVVLKETGEHYRESAGMEPGPRPVVVDTPFGRLGLAVCYDLRFPELFRSLSTLGIDIIAAPSAFTALTGKAHWEILVRARAVENLAYVIAADQSGFHDNGQETYGHSMIVDPWGRMLATRERDAGPVIAEVDLDYLQTVRRDIPCLEHRRIRCY